MASFFIHQFDELKAKNNTNQYKKVSKAIALISA